MIQQANFSACDTLQQKFLFLDLYRRPFMFLLPDKMPMYRSLLGSVLSILTVVAIISYATYKLIQLEGLEDYKIN